MSLLGHFGFYLGKRSRGSARSFVHPLIKKYEGDNFLTLHQPHGSTPIHPKDGERIAGYIEMIQLYEEMEAAGEGEE